MEMFDWSISDLMCLIGHSFGGKILYETWKKIWQEVIDNDGLVMFAYY